MLKSENKMEGGENKYSDMLIVCPVCKHGDMYNICIDEQNIRKCTGCGTILVIDDFWERIKMTFDYFGKP